MIALVGCQGHKAPAPAAGSAGSAAGSAVAPTVMIDDAYRADIDNLCDVMKRSGADQLSESEQQPTIAMWLGPNIKTQAGHDFLVKINPLQGADKAKALDDEAARVGIASCPLSAVWRR